MRKLMSLVVLLAALLMVGGVSASGDTAQPTLFRASAPDPTLVEFQEIVNGLIRPLFLTHAGDSRLFVMTQNGFIYIVQNGSLLTTPFLDVSSLLHADVFGGGYTERGLLGLAFHPNYALNGQFFINYTDRSGSTVVARYRVSSDRNLADPNSGEILLTQPQPYPNHNGGHLEFGPDGYLYIAMGDGGAAGDPQGNGQNPAALLGKILRIDVDGGTPYAIPADNPAFTVNPDLAPEVWAWGLRNPWRMSFDRATGDLYMGDVGQNNWEEVNFQPASSAGGENYGWNIFEATRFFSGAADPGTTTLPFFEYPHSEGNSVTGGYVYRGTDLPSYDGAYFFGDFGSGRIWASYRDEAGAWQTNLFADTDLNISSFGQDVNGELYIVHYTGTVLKFVPA
jgi:glucose/arabinose dehydrogenase